MFFLYSFIEDISLAKNNLLIAKRSLIEGLEKANKFNLGGARGDLKSAEEAFASAQVTLSRPAPRIAALIPAFGSNISAIDKLARSGREATRAGLSLLDAAEALSLKSDNMGSLYVDGRLNLGPFKLATKHMELANHKLAIAQAEAKEAQKGLLIPQIKKPLKQYSEEIDQIYKSTVRVEKVLRLIPSFLGSDEKRSYFLAVQNNTELRATGGLIGDYGIVTVNNGKIELVKFEEIHVLERENQLPVKATKDFIERYERFASTSNWLNANMSPDFPTVSNVLLQLYEDTTGERLDGIIGIDPVGLKYLLEAIGPTQTQDGIVVEAKNAIDWTLVDAYKVFEERQDRKDFLKDVATAVWKRIERGDFKDPRLLSIKLTKALNDKHMVLYSTLKSEEQTIKDLGYAGALDTTKGDYLQVVVQNQGGNKVDVYLDQHIDYNASINKDGMLVSKVTVTLKNNAPRTGLPLYVSGSHPLGAKDAESHLYLSAYVPGGSRLLKCTHNSKKGNPEIGSEMDKTIFSYYLKIPAGEKEAVSFTYANSYSIQLTEKTFEYRLDWQAQPVIKNPRFNLNISYPNSHHVTTLSGGLVLKRSEVGGQGELMRDLKYSFGLEESERGWFNSFRKWLKKPLF